MTAELRERLQQIGPLPRIVEQSNQQGRADVVTIQTAPPADTGWAGSPEGFRLHVDTERTTISATTDAGINHGRQLLNRLTGSAPIPACTIQDWPEVSRRGIIEGFYGPPWSWTDRRNIIEFAAAVRLNDYVYAPKDDPFHRAHWRTDYPPADLTELAGLAGAAEQLHIRFAVGLSTGLDMRYADDAEHRLLRAKAEQLRSAGIRHLVLLFDDIGEALVDPSDLARFGPGPAGLARAHAYTCIRLSDAVPSESAFAMVPTDYSGNADSAYRSALRRTLPDHVDVYWTGPETVTGTITATDLVAARRTFARPVQLWDNFPVNDFAPNRLFLGPLTGRPQTLDPADVRGVAANPMIQAAPSKVPLATFAEWAWNPDAYQPDIAWTRAIRLITGANADALRSLFEACRAWPPEAPRHPRLAAVLADAPTEPAGRNTLRTELADWIEAPQRLRDHHQPLIDQLRPWLTAAAAEAHAAESALAAIDGTMDKATATTAIAQARANKADVCQDLLLDFASDVLRGLIDTSGHDAR